MREHSASPSDGPPEILPGYGAGYDAGFLAGLLAASQGEAPPPDAPPRLMTATQGRGGPARPPLLALVEDCPDLFQKEVLERLDRVDRALLGRTGSAVRAAVKRSGLPRVGSSDEEARVGFAPGRLRAFSMSPRVGIALFCKSLSMFVWAVANGCPWHFAATTRTLAQGGHLEVLR